jgi:hypothetical protein
MLHNPVGIWFEVSKLEDGQDQLRKTAEYQSEINWFCSGGFYGDVTREVCGCFQKGEHPAYLLYMLHWDHQKMLFKSVHID